MSLETRTRVTEEVRQDGTIQLSVASRTKLLQVYMLFVIIGTWIMAPLALMLGFTATEFLKMPGIPFAVAAALFGLVSLITRLKGSGTVLIDSNNSRLVKKQGFPDITWSEMDVPRYFIVLQDSFTRESSMRQSSSTSIQASQSQEKELIYRLSVIPTQDVSDLGLQEKWKAVIKHETDVKSHIYKMAKTAPLPQGAMCVIEGYNYSLNQVLGEALQKAFDAPLFDFTFAEPVIRGAEDQDIPFIKHLHDIEVKSKPDGEEKLKRPRRVRAKIRKRSMLLKVAAQSTGTAIAAGTALPAVLCIISWMGMFFFTFETNIPVLIAYVALGFFLGGFMHRVVIDERCLRIKLTSYGILPLGKSQFISWNEIGELRPLLTPGNSRLAIMSRSGEGQLGHLVLPDEKAGRWILQKIASYLRSRQP